METENFGQILEVVEGKIVATGSGVACPRCGSAYVKRMRRTGFLQKKVYSFFGYYPWRCTKCLGNFLLKKRGVPRMNKEVSPRIL